jgi:PDZ domain/Aspartyl protease
MYRKICAFLALAFLPVLAGAQSLGFSLTDGRKRIQIPIEIFDNLVVVPVTINGRLPLRFILDTGVRTTILTEKSFSDALNLVYSKKYTISAPGGARVVDAYITNNVSIDLYGLHGEGHAMLVLAEDYLELRNYLGTEVHGILGYELFSRFIVKINYKKKVLELMLPEKFKPGKKYQPLPIVVQDTKPYVFADLEMNEADTTKLKVKLLVDTGASHGLLLEPESNPLIKLPSKHVSSIIGRGLGGMITGQIGRIGSLDLGTNRIQGVIANFPDPNSYTDTLKSSLNIFRNGTIGGEVLNRFTVVFDFPRELMYFKRNSYFRKKFYYNLSGLTIKADGLKLTTFEITSVRKGSTADKADVQSGDKILSINGSDVDELNLNNVIALFNSRPGRKIRMKIDREGKRISREFKLENQI